MRGAQHTTPRLDDKHGGPKAWRDERSGPTDRSMNVLVAGAGYVGMALAQRLAAGGHRVWAARRSEAPTPQGVVLHRCDFTRASVDVPPNLDAVVYAVAPDRGHPEDYERTYVTGLRNLLDALERASPALRRIVFVSSTSVFAEGEEVDEDSPVRTDDDKARALLEAESLCLAHPSGVVLRLAGIYGPGRDRLVRMVREGTARCARSRPIGNRIHRDDCAGALEHLLTLERPERLYLGVDHAPVPLCEVYRWIAARIGVSAPPESDEADARGGTRKRCSNARLVASGYRFIYPTYREGYESVLRM